jgi:hypothetical protein
LGFLLEWSGYADGIADEEDNWRWAYCGGAEVFKCGGSDLLIRGGGFAYGYRWGRGGNTGVYEAGGEGAKVAAGHVEDEGGVVLPYAGDGGSEVDFAGGVVGGSQDEL